MRLFFDHRARRTIASVRVLALWAVIAPFAHANHCEVWLTGTAKAEKLTFQNLASSQTAEHPTVHFERLDSNGEVVFTKNDEVEWISVHKYLENSLTPQGDLRNPIFLFGVPLASRLHFRIQRRDSQHVELRAPGAQLYGKILDGLNAGLKKRNAATMLYRPLPVAGLVDHVQSMKLALSAPGDFMLGFPYADNDPKLTGHEVAFHLGEIILTHSLVERASAINWHTMNLAVLINQYRHRLGPISSEVIDQLLLERSLEIDAGGANLIGHLAEARSRTGLAPYRDLLLRIFNAEDREMLESLVEYFARPALLPLEAVFMRLHAMTDVKLDGIITPKYSFSYLTTKADPRFGRRIDLTTKESETLKKILHLYKSKHRDNLGRSTAATELRHLMLNLDVRIRELTEVYDEIAANPKLIEMRWHEKLLDELR